MPVRQRGADGRPESQQARAAPEQQVLQQTPLHRPSPRAQARAADQGGSPDQRRAEVPRQTRREAHDGRSARAAQGHLQSHDDHRIDHRRDVRRYPHVPHLRQGQTQKTQKEMNDLNDRLKQSEERAKNADAEARRREERIQQDCNNRLSNLVSQQANREDKIAKLMADQMDSKLSEIKKGYGTVISSLQSTIGSLNKRLDSERTNYRNNYKSDLDGALKAQAKLYDEQHTKQANIYKSQIEDLNKRKPEVHHHHHSLCKIM